MIFPAPSPGVPGEAKYKTIEATLQLLTMTPVTSPSTTPPAIGKKRNSRKWLITALLILLTAGIGRFVIWPHISNLYDPGDKSSSADVTEYLQVPPPPEAHDFHVAAFREMIAASVFVRFSAPPDICKKYAETIIPGKPLASLDYLSKNMDLQMLQTSAWHLPDLRWFDLPYARSCWAMQSGKPVFQLPPDNILNAPYPDLIGTDTGSGERPTGLTYTVISVRVDVARGIFYCELAN
jgi:hypothetical protein